MAPVEIKTDCAGSIVPTLRNPRRVGQPAGILDFNNVGQPQDPEKHGPAPGD